MVCQPYYAKIRLRCGGKYEKLGMAYKLAGVPAMDKDKLIEKKKVILDGVRKRREELGRI